MPGKPYVVVTRKLPDSIETRMMELFRVKLNLEDNPLSQAELIEAAKTADVLVPTVTDRIDDILRSAQDSRAFSCAAWSVGTAERVESAGVIGEISWGGTAANVDTLWDLASVTKPIVAMAVMALVQDGHLTLDDSVGEHLADYRGTVKEHLTVRQLLTHTAGLPGEPGAAVDRRGQCPRTGPAPNDAPGRCAQEATMRKRTVRALPVRPVVPFGVTRRT